MSPGPARARLAVPASGEDPLRKDGRIALGFCGVGRALPALPPGPPISRPTCATTDERKRRSLRSAREQLVRVARECGYADGTSVGSFKKDGLVDCLLRQFETARAASDPTTAQRKALEWLAGRDAFPGG